MKKGFIVKKSTIFIGDSDLLNEEGDIAAWVDKIMGKDVYQVYVLKGGVPDIVSLHFTENEAILALEKLSYEVQSCV